MKILTANKYYYNKGGSEQSMFNLSTLLKSKGHSIAYFSMADPRNIQSGDSDCFISNIDYDEAKGNPYRKLKSAANIIFNAEANKLFEKQINQFKPDLIISHNIYHQISPSVYSIARKHRVPAIQFLHDYKVTCPVYTLLSNGTICNEQCRNKKYYNCFIRRCHKSSAIKSLINTIELYIHTVFPNYYGMVSLYISPSRFLSQTILSMGFKHKNIITIPHFVDTKGITPSYTWKNNEIIYFGRLSKEKGLKTLVYAMADLPFQLKIIGSGPLLGELQQIISLNNIQNVVFIPHMNHDDLLKQVASCMFTVVPSEWYENCPYTVIESFVCGKPVIGAKIGGIPEFVINNSTGLTFEPGNVSDLREKIRQLAASSNMITSFGKNARSYVERELNPEAYYEKLMHTINTKLHKKP